MSGRQGFPVLWFVGASGTGKSDASYWTFATLAGAGRRVARVETDDLGMLRPAPDDDPAGLRLKAAGLAAAVRVHREHGAAAVVVSGCVSTRAEAELHTSLVPDAAWTLVRLRVDADERRRRLAARETGRQRDAAWVERMVASALRDEADLDADRFYDHDLEITGLDRPTVARRALDLTGWPGD